MTQNDKTFIAQKIRTQYVNKTPTDLDELKKLDAKVKRPATVYGYTFGIVSALIMGAGMSLIMTDLAKELGIAKVALPLGIVLGVVGLVGTLLNYPTYQKILKKRKQKFSQAILALSEKIMNQ